MDGKKTLVKKNNKKRRLTSKQKRFCHEYIVDWNKSRAARDAGYAESTARAAASKMCKRPEIQEYIEEIREDFEKTCGISKTRILQEYMLIAFSDISDYHDTWIDLVQFENIKKHNPKALRAVESIESRTEKKMVTNLMGDKEPVEVKQIKMKLYSKLSGLEGVRKVLGHDKDNKLDVNVKSDFLNLMAEATGGKG